jgi:hypothetical protein
MVFEFSGVLISSRRKNRVIWRSLKSYSIQWEGLNAGRSVVVPQVKTIIRGVAPDPYVSVEC